MAEKLKTMIGVFGLRQLYRLTLVALATVVAAIVLLVGVTTAGGNFHTVVADEVYRSAQPSGAALSAYQKRYGIRAVLNLRGRNENDPWYRDEIAATDHLGIHHIDFPMSARRGITNAQALELIEIMRRAPKPLLIHCESGADRTGLAAALYLAAVTRAGEDAAENQLSIRYGHIAQPWGKGYGMTVTFEAMEPVLGYAQS